MWATVGHVMLCLVLIATFNTLVVCQEIGESCYHSGQDGICKSMDTCPIAIKGLRQNKLPKICSFNGTTSIVCCVAEVENLVPTTSSTGSNGALKPLQNLNVGAKSLQKCQEYQQHIKVSKKSPLLIPGMETIETVKCPFATRKLIAGSLFPEPGEFPHMALIGYSNNNETDWLCAGSLISDKFILMPAHCAYSRAHGSATVVRLGAQGTPDSSLANNVQKINITKILVHPNFKYPSVYNDIALVELEHPATMSPYIRPACLSTKRELENHAVTTGLLLKDQGEQNERLFKVAEALFNVSVCNKTYHTSHKLMDGINDDLQICAGARYPQTDTCESNAGGPLQVYSKIFCMYDIIGIASFGGSCGFAGPTVYTRVFTYLEWIEKNVWP